MRFGKFEIDFGVIFLICITLFILLPICYEVKTETEIAIEKERTRQMELELQMQVNNNINERLNKNE